MKKNLIMSLMKRFSQNEHWFSHFFEDTDLIVASYPRSGNTVLRFALAEAKENRAFSVNELDRYTIDLFQSRVGFYPKSNRIIKWHGYPSEGMEGKKILYIYREQKFVARSLYTYLKYRHGIYKSDAANFINAFLTKGLQPFGRHKSHLKIWQAFGATNNILFIPFEKLIEQDRETISEIANFTDTSVDMLINSIAKKRNYKRPGQADFFLSTQGHDEFEQAWGNLFDE